MRLQLKILFGIKALPISKKTRQNCWRGGGYHPHPLSEHSTYEMYQALGNTLSNLLVSAAENCEFMIHTLSGTTSVSGSVQYPLRMNLILSNFELSNAIG